VATVTTFDPVRTPAKKARKRAESPPGKPANLAAYRIACGVVGLVGGIAVGLAFTGQPLRSISAPGGFALLLGNLAGMAGGYLALVMVLLVSRIPLVERVLGQDGLIRFHKRLAAWPLSLIAAHALLVVVGLAQASHSGLGHETGSVVSQYPWMIEATIGWALMMAIGLISVRAIRTRIRRERWWAIHLMMYLALALSFGHVVTTGTAFVAHPLTQAAWDLIWLATAGSVIVYRIGLPVVRSLRHRLVVAEVRRETADVVSIVLKGRRLDRLAVSGGQFFEWRFLTPKMAWQAHPFSLSARPSPPYMRLTVKASGDFSAALANIEPGTRVAVEGPYGVFTTHVRRRRKVAMIAGGIGVTAARCLLEDLPRGCDPVVILRGTTAEDLPLAAEVAELVRHRRGRVHELLGSRSAVNLDKLHDLVPDLAQRDVFISGPQEFVYRVAAIAANAGVPAEAIHFEAYAL
jgi:predicted ferric reductase